MCTVIIRVPATTAEPVRLIAVRDEDPDRAWNAVGPWWPEAYPGVVGVRDVRAGGAWLAADPDAARLSVILNRADLSDRADEDVTTRGAVALDSVVGEPPAAAPTTRAFNLVEVTARSARVVSWDGIERRERVLEPGIHMVAHDEVDDAGTARIARWLGEFRAAAPDEAVPADDIGAEASEDWFDPWLDVLDRSAALAPDDDRAIIRDNRPFGYPTLSLLLCTATVGQDGVDVRYGAFERPGVWERTALGAAATRG